MPICFIILFISPDMTPCMSCLAWLKSLMNLLTSTKVFPEPAAIRRRRLGLTNLGFLVLQGSSKMTMARLRAIWRFIHSSYFEGPVVSHTWNHLEQVFHWSHVLNLIQLIDRIIEVKGVFAHLLSHFKCFCSSYS